MGNNVQCVACAQPNDMDQKCDCTDGFVAAEGDCLTFFLKHYDLGNTDINDPDRTGRTMLNIAAKMGNYRIVRYLILHGAEVNFPETKAGNSPLHEAAFHDHASVVSLLIGAGARTDMRNKFGQLPADATKSSAIKEFILHPSRQSHLRFTVPPHDRKPHSDLVETEHLLHSDSDNHHHRLKHLENRYHDDDDDDDDVEEDVEEYERRRRASGHAKEAFSLEMIEEVFQKLVKDDPTDEFAWLVSGIRYSVYRYHNRPMFVQKLADTFVRLYTLELNLQHQLNTDLCTGNIESKLLPFAHALRAAALKQPGHRAVCYRVATLSRDEIKQYQSLPDGCWLGFSSCTKRRELCEDIPGNVIFEIHPHIYSDEDADETSVARDISGVSPFPDEDEVLILNGACFRVTSVSKPSFGGLKGKWTIQVKLTPRRVLVAIGRMRANKK